MREPLQATLCLALLAAAVATPSAEAVQPIAPEVANLDNLLRNPGFEEGDALPKSWGRYPPKDAGGNRIVRDTRVARSGKASGLVWSVAPYEAGKPWMQFNQYGLPVEGGTTVIVSLWTRGEGVGPGNAGLHFYDPRGGHLGFAKIASPKDAKAGEWAYVRESVSVPEAAAKLGFAAYAAEKGKTWFDDCAVIATPTATAARATPTVDGRLDEPCWADARAIARFAVHTGARLAAARTRAWLAYDDDKLYVAFECPHPDTAALRAQATRHDGDVWLDDSIEVFLDPQHGHRDYYQLCVSSRGVIRDSQGTDLAWESGAQAAAVRRAAAWTVELAVPYDKLGLSLDTGSVWGINLVRNDRVRGETVTWSLGGFHAPDRFGNVRLRPDLSRFCRVALARRVKRLDDEMKRLANELVEAELPAPALLKATKALLKARNALAALGAIAKGRVKLPPGGWQAVRRLVAGVPVLLATARAAALEGLFGLQSNGKGGFRVAIAHSLQKVRRSGPVPEGQLTRRVRLDAARDEAESFQLVVLPAGQELKGVAIEVAPLKGPLAGKGGETQAPTHEIPLVWRRVAYVETAQPGYPTEYVGWWPDPLLPAGTFDVAADQRQPLWLTALVPPEARPGLYRGKVTVRCGERSVRVPVELRVRPFRLPRPGTLAAPFGLYASALSHWYFGKAPYRERLPIQAFARWCRFLGEYRLTPKNVAREYVDVHRAGKGVSADLTALEQTVAPLAERYFAPYSFCLDRLPVASRLRKEDGRPSAAALAAITGGIAEQWRRQHLPQKVYIYGVDEPGAQDYPFLQELYREVRKAAPGFPIMQTIGDPHPQALVGLVDIWCPLTRALASRFYADRLNAGDTLWTYVCCSPKPPYANFFVDQPATAHRVLFWQARQAGATGLLYWCVCWWYGLPNAASGKPCFPDAPLRLAEHGTHRSYKVNGDGLLVYPGPKLTPYPSIRLEVIRDGIEDYEYLALLARLIARAEELPARRRPPPELLRKAKALSRVPSTLSRSLTDYTHTPAHVLERRRQVADAIERLTALLTPRRPVDEPKAPE